MLSDYSNKTINTDTVNILLNIPTSIVLIVVNPQKLTHPSPESGFPAILICVLSNLNIANLFFFFLFALFKNGYAD